MRRLQFVCRFGWAWRWLARRYAPANKPVQLFGLQFNNPVGLAAGFDKNACYLRELQALGFGHIEIGTVTPRPQAGNPKPRLFRLPEDKALINRMGFNNDGVEAIAQRLEKWRSKGYQGLIIGGNIGKNKDTPNEYAYMDYDKCFRALHPYVDYFVVNVSSPNTPGLRQLQERSALHQILTHLQAINAQMPKPRPLLLKIAPDLTAEQLDDVASLALEIKLDGLVASNTSLNRTVLSDAGKIRAGQAGDGGLSGAPVAARATEVVQHLWQKTNGTIPIIGSGGIFTAADARQKLEAGASLVQVWTGFIYMGPGIVRNICQDI